MRITFAVGSRANAGSMRAVIERLSREHAVNAICYGTSLLSRYGEVVNEVAKWCPVTRVATHVPGGTPIESVIESGYTLERVGSELEAQRPDLVYVVGDRYEVVPVAYAAHLLGLPLAQQMAGEVSGTIDDRNRHAITQLATYHFCATEKSHARVLDMIGGAAKAFVTGCPRIDIAATVQPYKAQRPYIVVCMHPDVHSWEQAGEQMRAVLDGVDEAWDGDVRLWWPNSDSGCEAIVEAVRRRKREYFPYLTYRSVEDREFYALLAGARCAVGNSSSFIREGSFLGVPVVLVGDRQDGRERAQNAQHWDFDAIDTGIKTALNYPRPEPSTLYGSGDAAEKIAEVIRG